MLVARREDKLRELADSVGCPATWVAADLTDDDAPQRVLDHVMAEHGRLTFLLNNAGAAWRATFADGGYANVKRTMDLNFDAVVRLTEALLPLLRESKPSSIVNISSTAGRVARPGTGAYSASKFALAGWTDSLYYEEKPNGVHVGLVLPGFIRTEGFPAAELPGWMVSEPDKAAKAILQAGPGGKPERYVPRGYWLTAAVRIVLPSLIRRVLSGESAQRLTTKTGADAADQQSASS